MKRRSRFVGLTLLRVNQNAIRSNQGSKGHNEARVLTVTYPDGREVECNSAVIHGPSRLVYSPDQALPNGSRVWMETEADVTTGVDTLEPWH